MNLVLPPDCAAFQEGNLIVKGDAICLAQTLPFTIFEKLNYLKAGIKLIIAQYFRS